MTSLGSIPSFTAMALMVAAAVMAMGVEAYSVLEVLGLLPSVV